MAKPRAVAPLPPHPPVTPVKLPGDSKDRLARYLGSPLTKLQGDEIKYLLGTHRTTVANIKKTTPANVIAALDKAKKRKSIDLLLLPNSGIDEETYDLLVPHRNSTDWTKIEAAIDSRTVAIPFTNS